MIKEILREIVDLFYELIEKEEVWFFLFLFFLFGYFAIGYINLEIKPNDIYSFINFIWHFFKKVWFLWLFLILFYLNREIWLFYRQELFKKNIEWALIEIKFPKVNDKDPKAMEFFLSNLITLRNEPSTPISKFVAGEITRWFSLEIVSFGGQIHFYIRTYRKFIKAIESFFYSVYPNAELIIVENDYIDKLPKNLNELYSLGMDLWGMEFILAKESLYPILSYNYFFNRSKEDKSNDPIFNLFEVMGRIGKNDFLGFQILIRPKRLDWGKKWSDKLKEIKKSISSNVTVGVSGEIYKKEVSVLREVENNISKPAFDVVLRVIYLSPKEMFFDSFVRSGIISYLNRFNSADLNSFRPNFKAGTMISPWYFPYFFVKERTEIRKQRILINYRLREIPPESFFAKLFTSHILDWNNGSSFFELNVEGLATLFHLPTEVIFLVPYVETKVMSKKTGPPSDLPIFGNEEEIDKFNY